jgi:formamidopyrimidine-DNA glycosylase
LVDITRKGERPVPELPEVETIVRCLRRPLRARKVVRASLRPTALYRRGSLRVSALAGREIARVERVGKNAVFRFDPPVVMVVNLGMTGQLLLDPSCGCLPETTLRHLHGRFSLDDGSELRYYDIRRFGFIFVTGESDVFAALGIGPDPFDADRRYLAEKLRGREAAVKTLLLDQRILSGIGNIYADETLFDARIDPRRSGARVAPRAEVLLLSARRILSSAIAHKGSTIRDYRRPDGSRGGFQHLHAVYGREGGPCVRCGALIRKIVLGGRGTHFCPVCQS